MSYFHDHQNERNLVKQGDEFTHQWTMSESHTFYHQSIKKLHPSFSMFPIMAPHSKKAVAIVPATSLLRAIKALGANDLTVQQTMIEFIMNSETANRTFIGFTCLNIIKRKIEFRPWNQHECKAAEVSKLLDSFHYHHVSCFKPMHVMPILLNRACLVDGGWIPHDTPRLNFPTGYGISMLKLMDDPSLGANRTVGWT